MVVADLRESTCNKLLPQCIKASGTPKHHTAPARDEEAAQGQTE